MVEGHSAELSRTCALGQRPAEGGRGGEGGGLQRRQRRQQTVVWRQAQLARDRRQQLLNMRRDKVEATERNQTIGGVQRSGGRATA